MKVEDSLSRMGLSRIIPELGARSRDGVRQQTLAGYPAGVPLPRHIRTSTYTTARRMALQPRQGEMNHQEHPS